MNWNMQTLSPVIVDVYSCIVYYVGVIVVDLGIGILIDFSSLALHFKHV